MQAMRKDFLGSELGSRSPRLQVPVLPSAHSTGGYRLKIVAPVCDCGWRDAQGKPAPVIRLYWRKNGQFEPAMWFCENCFEVFADSDSPDAAMDR